jgi:hypothetical protein
VATFLLVATGRSKNKTAPTYARAVSEHLKLQLHLINQKHIFITLT